MALDGVFLSFLKNEINRELRTAKVDRVQQPEKDEIDLVFRLKSGSARLLISSSANYPRIHLTEKAKENPAAPPMFCMLLRKHLTGARLREARQPELERILFLDFDCYDEFGDETVKTLAVEIMGRHSNIILLDDKLKIMDAVKHIDITMSSVRQVLPGLSYELPPAQDKLDFLETPAEEIAARAAEKDGDLPKVLLGLLKGLSPVICRELAQLSCRTTAVRSGSLDAQQKERLAFFVAKLAQDVRTGEAKPVMISDAKTRKPMDVAFMDITQYGTAAVTKVYGSFSRLLDAFYAERDRIERFNQRSQDMLKVIAAHSEKMSRKIQNQAEDLAECSKRQRLKICGDLISSNLYCLRKGDAVCRAENYYEEGSPLVEIRLDPMLSPAMNAQKYYREYRKAATAEKFLLEQTALAKRELAYMDTIFDELSRAESTEDLAEIREELETGGYLRRRGARNKSAKPSKPLRFRSTDGFLILVGRNNRQNDLLTLKTAAKSDVWLHTRNIPGAHVIICCEGNQPPDRTVAQAAMLAALHSKARDSRQVPVDYTQARRVKKPSGAKPGMVIYDNFRTAFVNPDPSLLEKLKCE